MILVPLSFSYWLSLLFAVKELEFVYLYMASVLVCGVWSCSVPFRSLTVSLVTHQLVLHTLSDVLLGEGSGESIEQQAGESSFHALASRNSGAVV